MNNIKVYKMNDYEWWASKWSAEKTNAWYNENIEDNDIEEVKECDLDKEGMWYFTEDEEDIKRIGEDYELINIEIVNGQAVKKPKFGDLQKEDGDVYKYMSYREAIQYDLDFEEPYCIASIEY